MMFAVRLSSLQTAYVRYQSNSCRVRDDINALRHIATRLSSLGGMENASLSLRRVIAQLEREAALLGACSRALEQIYDCYAAYESSVMNGGQLWRANPLRSKWKRNDLSDIGRTMEDIKLI